LLITCGFLSHYQQKEQANYSTRKLEMTHNNTQDISKTVLVNF